MPFADQNVRRVAKMVERLAPPDGLGRAGERAEAFHRRFAAFGVLGAVGLGIAALALAALGLAGVPKYASVPVAANGDSGSAAAPSGIRTSSGSCFPTTGKATRTARTRPSAASR